MKSESSAETLQGSPPLAPRVGPVSPSGRLEQSSDTRLSGALREYWRYRELFFFFVWRDVKVRYKQTALGASWAVLQPVLAMLVFTALFGRVAKLPHDGIPYPLFYYSALLPWTYFSTAFSKSSNSLILNTNLLTKIYFPRVLIPASAVLTGLFDFLFASLILLGMIAFYGSGFHWTLLLWPVLLLPLVGLALGAGCLMSALNVSYRDVKHTLPFLVQIGMFVSPVVYPVSMIPERYRTLAWLNPVAGVIESFRATIAGTPIPWQGLGISAAVTTLALLVGFAYFRRTERSFADII